MITDEQIRIKLEVKEGMSKEDIDKIMKVKEMFNGRIVGVEEEE